jgi:hypothetical protein
MLLRTWLGPWSEIVKKNWKKRRGFKIGGKAKTLAIQPDWKQRNFGIHKVLR